MRLGRLLQATAHGDAVVGVNVQLGDAVPDGFLNLIVRRAGAAVEHERHVGRGANLAEPRDVQLRQLAVDAVRGPDGDGERIDFGVEGMLSFSWRSDIGRFSRTVVPRIPPGTSSAPWRVYNIGNSRPVELLDYIAAIERCTGRKATMNLLPLQPGDVPDTMADVSALESDTGYRPTTTVETGVARFVEWYRSYYGV